MSDVVLLPLISDALARVEDLKNQVSRDAGFIQTEVATDFLSLIASLITTIGYQVGVTDRDALSSARTLHAVRDRFDTTARQELDRWVSALTNLPARQRDREAATTVRARVLAELLRIGTSRPTQLAEHLHLNRSAVSRALAQLVSDRQVEQVATSGVADGRATHYRPAARPVQTDDLPAILSAESHRTEIQGLDEIILRLATHAGGVDGPGPYLHRLADTTV